VRHVLLGRSGLRGSELCLGGMTFGETRGYGATDADSRAIFDAFADAGGSFIDTADHYADGASETLLGEFIGSDRDRFVIGTKWSVSKVLDVTRAGNSRRNMHRAVEASLRRLKTDRIDLYFLHIWDFTTPWEEILRGLDDLVRSGKVLYIGISDTPAWEISRAQMLAELRGWTAFTALQIPYSLAQRTVERELLPMAAALGIGITAWSPLAAGVLSGKYGSHNRMTAAGRGTRGAEIPEPTIRIADAVIATAKRLELTPAQVALAWVRQQSGGCPIVPIIGARTPAQFADNLACLDAKLDNEALRALDEVSRIEAGFPHEFLQMEMIQTLLQGGQAESLVPRHGRWGGPR
jgi:aryl-alcohol dehydrogenase-like predicted oxidoreductase